MPKSVGTRREIADREILRFHRAIERAKLGGRPSIAVCRAQLDRWLEYRYRAQQNGTLDDEAFINKLMKRPERAGDQAGDQNPRSDV